MSTHDPTNAPPPVVMACAEADLSTVTPAAEALRARGHEVEVVSDAGVEPELLVTALRRHDAEGLYVLCRSDALDRGKIDQLRASLRSHDVPFGRTLTLALDRGNSRVLEDRIVSVVRRMVTGRPTVGSKPKAPVPRPPALGKPIESPPEPPPLSAPTPTPVQPEASPPPPAASEIAAWADSLARRAAPALPDYAGAEPTRFDGPAAEVFPVEELGGSPGDTTAKAPPSADDPWIPGDLPVSDDARTQPLPQEPELVRELLADVEARASEPGPAQRARAAATSPNPILGDDDEGWRDNRRTAVALTIGGGAVVLSVLFAVFAWRGDDEEPLQDDVAAHEQSERAQGAEVSGGNETPQKKAPNETPSERPPELESAAEDDAEDRQDQPTEDEPAVVVKTDAEAEPGEIEPAGDPEPVEVDAREVLAALQSREVRALDTLIVTAERTNESSFAAATAHCEGLVVAGLGGWRLPEIGELFSIGDANLLRRGIYWSVTVGDVHGDDRLVYNTRRSRIAPVRKDWDGAHAVCVRPRS